MTLPNLQIEVTALCPVCAPKMVDLEMSTDGWSCGECESTWDLTGEKGEPGRAQPVEEREHLGVIPPPTPWPGS